MDQLTTAAGEALSLTPTPLQMAGPERALLVLRNWHDDQHPGAFKFCSLQPCDGVRRALAPISLEGTIQ